MKKIGIVKEIWRYPVSSLGGERCRRAQVNGSGICGDRQYALFDAFSGAVAAPEKDSRWRPALFLSSRICDNDITQICFPDGRRMDVNEPGLLPYLRDHFGFDVAVGQYGEPTAQNVSLPQVSNRYDLAPLHLLTTASLCEIVKTAPESAKDPRRFRPNILIETDCEASFAETDWLGAKLSIGPTTLNVSEPTKRCGMTFIGQPGLEEEPEILRNIVRKNRRTLGVYCDVMISGSIELGAAVNLQIQSLNERPIN